MAYTTIPVLSVERAQFGRSKSDSSKDISIKKKQLLFIHLFILLYIHRYEDICPSTHNMDVPHVKREDYQLTDISTDGYLTLMSDNAELREDLKVPDGELGQQLKTEYDNGKELLVCISINRIFSKKFPPFDRLHIISNLFYFFLSKKPIFSAPYSNRVERNVLLLLKQTLLLTNKTEPSISSLVPPQ